MDINKVLISESDNAILYLVPEHSLIWIEFKDTDLLDEENYKKASLGVLDLVKQKGIKKMLFNTLKLKAVLSVDLQRWIAENVNKDLLQLLDKVAVVEPQNPITHLSLQQYIEESLRYGTRAKEAIFQDLEHALKWLLTD